MTSPCRILVGGTGTDVGKTTTVVRAAKLLSSAGHRVLAVKPIETGFLDQDWSDAAQIAAAAEHPFVPPAFVSSEPVAPMSAALAAGATIQIPAVQAWLGRIEEAHRPDVTLVETAGGMFTPLSPTTTNLDLLAALECHAWLLVARNRLGVLHDAIATVTATRTAGCSPDAIIFGIDESSAPRDNASNLERVLGVPVFESVGLSLLTAMMRRRWMPSANLDQ